MHALDHTVVYISIISTVFHAHNHWPDETRPRKIDRSCSLQHAVRLSLHDRGTVVTIPLPTFQALMTGQPQGLLTTGGTLDSCGGHKVR